MNFFKKLFGGKEKSLENTSMEELEILAKQGNAEALYWLGRKYHDGEEVEYDLDKALELYHLADKKGFVRATNSIGVVYFDDIGDYEEANIWFEKAANAGDERALFNWGRNLLYGYGIEQNVKKGIGFLERVGKLGLSGAYGMLGEYYSDFENIERNHELSIKYFLKGWELEKDANIANNIGIEYMDYGNYTEAYKYFIYASNEGLPHAMQNLGKLYQIDDNIKDYGKAREWYEKAAENDLIDGMYWAGRAYMWEVDDLKADYEKALYWLKEASKYGYADANAELGKMYEYGTGVEKDLIKSKHYYKLAKGSVSYGNDEKRTEILIQVQNLPALERCAENGEARAQYQLGEAYRQGLGVEEDKEKAFKWLKMAGEQKYFDALHPLARMYEEKDPKKAFEIYSDLAEQGMKEAIHNLGIMYYDGESIAQDYEKARILFEKSAELGISTSWYMLGLIYSWGLGVDKNIEKAITCYKYAENDPDAQHNLGCIYYNGEDVEQNFEKAFYYFEEAANNDFANSAYMVGKMYENGEGTKKDLKKALEYYQKAMEQGNEEAIKDFEGLQ